ncbi:MAG TPA: TIGR01212 family radical SAM protein [Bacteroidales bacterium]|nr:TIGR01212 family radical SAM protein [Bacteroidales bacterium]
MEIQEKKGRIYPWGHERRFNAYSNYFRKLYGSRVQKLSIDAGFTCPNRDGTKGRGGCSYCLNDAFNPSYCIPEKSITRQIEEGIEFHSRRYSEATSYLAYFQAFSNTYAPVIRLRELYEEALSHPKVIGIIIGTRPDCIDAEKLGYLRELSENHYVAVEYGIESCYDKTLKRINRGHTFDEAVTALKLSVDYGIRTGAHFIFGLPGESMEEMLSSAEIISGLPLHTVKFHQLQIIKGTPMEKEFRENPSDFRLFEWEEYLDFFIKFLEKLNPSLVVERFTGEAPPRFLTSMRWGRKRTDQLVSLVERRLEELDTWQGRLF